MIKYKIMFYKSLKRINDLNKNRKFSFITNNKIKKNNIKKLFEKKYKILKINSLIFKKKKKKKLFIILLNDKK